MEEQEHDANAKESRSSSDISSTSLSVTQSQNDLERILLGVPQDLEFPLEINSHLKAKVHILLEQNWHLKRHMEYLDKEVIELRKYRLEHRERCGRDQDFDGASPSASLMGQKIVELSKKTREMTAQTEAMKNKIHKLVRENESLRNIVECFRDKEPNEDGVTRSCSQLEIDPSSSTPGSQQNVQLTNKVIEYRRQNQLLRMELKTALRALSQEVGEGTTPHNVLTVIGVGAGTNPTVVPVPAWKGRQQQINSLQQKVAELQGKLKETSALAIANAAAAATNTTTSTIHSSLSEEQHGHGRQHGKAYGGGDADSCSAVNSNISIHSIPTFHIPQRTTFNQEKKKHEQIDKLTQELEQTRKDWKSAQQDMKACKARIQTLESNVKMYKSHVEILEGKLTESENAFEEQIKEMNQLKQELVGQRERERRFRDQAASEIQEAQRNLQRERAIVTRLQSVCQEKQDAILKQDAELMDMKSKLEISCSERFSGGVETVDKIRQMETQLKRATRAVDAGEKERQSLHKMMQDYLRQIEEERKKTIQVSEQSARVASILQRSNECISVCLDAGQVTSREVLQEVEHIRTLMRELQLGDLYVYEHVQHTNIASKLKTQVDMLRKEVTTLKQSLKEIATARRKDLENFGAVTERLKADLGDLISVKQKSVIYPLSPHFRKAH